MNREFVEMESVKSASSDNKLFVVHWVLLFLMLFVVSVSVYGLDLLALLPSAVLLLRIFYACFRRQNRLFSPSYSLFFAGLVVCVQGVQILLGNFLFWCWLVYLVTSTFVLLLACSSHEERGLYRGKAVGVMYFALLIGLVSLNKASSYGAAWSIFFLQFFLFAWIAVLSPALVKASWVYLLLAFVLWVLMLFVNTLASHIDGVIASVSRAHFMLGHFLLAWSVYASCRLFSWQTAFLLWPAFLAALVCLFSIIFVWVGLESPVSYDWFYDPPLFNHIRHMAYFLCFVSIVSVFWFFTAKDAMRMFASLFLVVSFSLLFWNGGRGAILAVVAASPLAFFCVGFSWPRLRYFIYLMMLCLALSLLFWVESRGIGWFNALWRSEAASDLNALSSGRLWIWFELLPFIIQRPFLGWGGESFLSVWQHELQISQAHNGLIQLLLDWGAVVALGIIGLICYFLARGIKALHAYKRQSPEALLLGVMIAFAMLVLAIFDGVFYWSAPASYLSIGMGLIAAGAYRKS